MRTPIPNAARALLLDGLIACLPEATGWEQEDRERWFRLLHFLLDWLFEIEEEN